VRTLVLERVGDMFRLGFDPARTVLEWLEEYGEVPLPPYLSRGAETSDDARYQTVYARDPGAVAAPTAGLHFDEAMLAALRDAGVETAFVTLHVGAGTFQPVRVEDLLEHRMHAERYAIPRSHPGGRGAARESGGRVCAVGTTSLRALESAARGGDCVAGEGETDLFITPGYRFKVVERLLTNFHLAPFHPAHAGLGLRRRGTHAPRLCPCRGAGYRFFSYGDAMLIEPAPERPG
jgi:S-adenosylmethionine:tRNA ribosyltransferase-isomerase